MAAAFVLAVFAWGIGFYGPSAFLHALHGGRGWSVSLVSAMITLHFLASAVVVARLPALHARFGVLRVTRVGICALALGAPAWAVAPVPAALLPAALLTALGWACTSGAAINTLVSRWFPQDRGRALAMAFNGASFGGIIGLPVWAGLIGWLGFPAAALIVGSATALVLWPLAGRYFRAEGPAPAPPPAASARELWAQPRMRSLSLAFAVGIAAQIGLLSQLFSMLAPALGEAGAGAAMSVATVCAILGRTLAGWLVAGGPAMRRAAMVNFWVQATGSLVLLWAGGSEIWALWLGCVLFGLGIGNLLSLPPLIAAAEFPPADVARVVALVTAVNQAFYAFAPMLFGLLRDMAGAGAMLALACALQLAASAMLRAR